MDCLRQKTRLERDNHDVRVPIGFQHRSAFALTIMSSQEQLSLRSLYSRALKAASKASSMPSIEVETQVGLIYIKPSSNETKMWDRNT